MKVRKTFLLLLIILTTGVLLPALVSASPSEQFYQRGGHIYDDWGIFRTRGFGADGFMAVTSILSSHGRAWGRTQTWLGS